MLDVAPKYFRASIARGASQVDRTGGKYGAGLISGVSVAMQGEALGHGLWVDQVFLSQVVDGINSKDLGLKSRFNHPSASGDALGTQVGKFFNARIENGKPVADLHILESATKTPDGNLADYVMTLAEEAPTDFGVSVAFMPDPAQEQQFIADHGGSRGFQSPDPANVENYPHARIGQLKAADVVDEPAANADGLFSRGNEIPRAADALLSYAFGLSADLPETVFGIHPDRLRGFAERWLGQHHIAIQKVEPMAEGVTAPAPVAVDADAMRKEFAAKLKTYRIEFGDKLGAEYFEAGLDWAEAVEMFSAEQKKTIVSLSDKIAELEKKIASLDLGEKEPATFSEKPPEGAKAKATNLAEGLSARINILGSSN